MLGKVFCKEKQTSRPAGASELQAYDASESAREAVPEAGDDVPFGFWQHLESIGLDRVSVFKRILFHGSDDCLESAS